MLYADKTEMLRRGLFDVQNEVGLGRSEECYHQAFRSWLTANAIPHTSKKPHALQLGAETAHVLYPDFVAWDCITLEMKAIPRRLRDEDRVQIFNYLKRRDDRLGLLVNMGLDRVLVERIVRDSVDCALKQRWDAATKDSDLGVCAAVRHALLGVFDEHQTGYGSLVTEQLILASLRNNGLSFVRNPKGPSYYMGKDLGDSSFDCILIEQTVLLTFTALFDDNTFNVHRATSFMQALGIPRGVAANFGKRKLQIAWLTHPT